MHLKLLALLGFLCLTVLADNDAINITASELFSGFNGSSDVATVHGWCTFYAKVWEQCYDDQNTNVYLKLSYVRDETGKEIPGLGKPVSGDMMLFSGRYQWTEMKVHGYALLVSWNDNNHVDYVYGNSVKDLKSWRDNEFHQCRRRSDWGAGPLVCKGKQPWLTYRWYDVDCGFTC